jgi:hypothetical protein
VIRFEKNMLVLDNTMTKQDVDAINEFADHIRNMHSEMLANNIANYIINCKSEEDWCDVCHGLRLALMNISGRDYEEILESI